ncbi:fibronectin type III domain-containing protein [Streptomyces sp. NPDC021020]|uniref:fibronectin type III domain-containing protein n=1 Tax=Streptomyces sp. NPDC021020 TaxID=3365109 RepID=UPI00379B1452
MAAAVAMALLSGTPATALAAAPSTGASAGEPGTAAQIRHADDDGSVTAAARRAAASGTRVEVLADRSETSTTWANPDGSLTTDLSAGPVRFKRDGVWVPVDVNLRRDADGSVRPAAQPGGLRLSGGGGARPRSLRDAQQSGTRDLVTLGEGDRQITLGWKGGLPAPELDGTRATYKDAVPGADVVVEATRTGYEQYVDIKQRPASGGYGYTLPVTTPGLTAVQQPDGSVSFTDSEGKVTAVMPAPVMWDARTDAVSGEHTHRARVGLKVVPDPADPAATDLVFTPDPAFLADPATQYPVTVDPSTSALGNAFDTYVQQGETVDWSTDVELDMGNPGTTNANGTPRTARSYITWNTAPIANALVSSATLSLWNFHSGNTTCAAQEWDVWATGKPSTASRWPTQPTWNTQYASSTQTKGNTACTAAGWITADVTNLAQIWASAQTATSNMGLRAASEATSAGWKRVNSANATSNPPKLSVTYNFRPETGTNRRAGPPYSSYSGTWVVNTLTPTLQDTFADPDGDTVDGTFQIFDTATNAQVGNPLVSPFVPSGTPASVTVPAGVLANGHTYQFRTSPYDGTHYNLGWSAWTTFTVDTTAPPKPASITTPDHPAGTWTAGAGQAAVFTVTPASTDLNWLEWSLDGGTWTRVTTGASAAPVNVTVPALTNGPHTMSARTVDKAGNTSAATTYAFGIGTGAVTSPAGPTASDGSPLALAATSTTGLTGVRWQYRATGATAYTDIPPADVTNSGTPLTSWPAATAANGTAPALTWDIDHSLAADGQYDLRALFTDATGGTLATAPVTVTLTRHTAPGAPAGVTATTRDSQVTVTWTAPTDDGGTPVTGYTVTTRQGATVVGTPITTGPGIRTATVTGLTNGTAYTIAVTADNAVGHGPETTVTATPQAATAPSAPESVTAVPTANAATVTWHQPADDGGADLDHYTVGIHLTSDGSLVASTTVPAGTLTTTVAGLTPARDYYAVVYATNTAGLDGTSATSAGFTTPTPPFTLTGLGAWKTTDPVNNAPMICLIWQIDGATRNAVSGEIHFRLAPVAGGAPDPASDWSVTFDPEGNQVPGVDGEYSWCSDTALLTPSPAGEQWTPTAFTARNDAGEGVALGSADLTGLTVTDPDGATDPAVFTTD